MLPQITRKIACCYAMELGHPLSELTAISINILNVINIVDNSLTAAHPYNWFYPIFEFSWLYEGIPLFLHFNAYLTSNSTINCTEPKIRLSVTSTIYAAILCKSSRCLNTWTPFLTAHLRPLKNVFDAADTRKKQAKKRSLCVINEHFEPVF